MESTAYNKLKERLRPLAGTGIELKQMSGEEIGELTPEQAGELVELFGGGTLIPLPEKERAFFDWLHEHDRPVWEDLWGTEENPGYYVSLTHLPTFLPKQRGFPICDLVDNDNYYFMSEDITEDGKVFVESAFDIIAEEKQITMQQAFVVEVWRGPIDQWRFAYMYNLPLGDVKKMVHWLISEGLIDVPKQRPENEPPIESAPPTNGADYDA